MDGSSLIWRSLLPDLSGLGPSELFYLFIVATVVVSSFAFLRRPFVNLSFTIFFLVSVNIIILGTALSATIATLLIVNSLIGIALVSGLKVLVERGSLRVPLLLCSVALLGAAFGVAPHGNQALLVLGDFYQIVEFTMLLILT